MSIMTTYDGPVRVSKVREINDMGVPMLVARLEENYGHMLAGENVLVAAGQVREEES